MIEMKHASDRGAEPRTAVENSDGLVVEYVASTKVCHRLKGSIMLNVTLKGFE